MASRTSMLNSRFQAETLSNSRCQVETLCQTCSGKLKVKLVAEKCRAISFGTSGYIVEDSRRQAGGGEESYMTQN